MASAEVIAAYMTGAAGVITAVGGLLVALKAALGARNAAEKAAASSIRAETTANAVGKQMGQHAYEVRDRLNTESLRAETMQRSLEQVVAGQRQRIPEESVGSYVRKAKAAQLASEEAARSAREALVQVQMMLGQTPTEPTKTIQQLTGPKPPLVEPLENE